MKRVSTLLFLAALVVAPTASVSAFVVEEVTVTVCGTDSSGREICIAAVPGPNVSLQQLAQSCTNKGAHFTCTPQQVATAGLSLQRSNR